jgi:ABC-type sulfate/molybdate transport systems ATPase subunit
MVDRPPLELEGVVALRGGRKVLDHIDLLIEPGPPFAIAGPSGSGKTTLLFAVAGLSTPDEGVVRVAGKQVSRLPPRERARTVGIVFQDYQLFPHLTVFGNVMLAPTLFGVVGCEARVHTLFDALGLAELSDRRPHELSGGQKQRVAIARTLALEPDLVLFDEPSAALDPRTTSDLARLLVELSEKAQFVVVSHDMAFLEQCCPRGVRLDRGRVTAKGELADVIGEERR